MNVSGAQLNDQIILYQLTCLELNKQLDTALTDIYDRICIMDAVAFLTSDDDSVAQRVTESHVFIGNMAAQLETLIMVVETVYSGELNRDHLERLIEIVAVAKALNLQLSEL